MFLLVFLYICIFEVVAVTQKEEISLKMAMGWLKICIWLRVPQPLRG